MFSYVIFSACGTQEHRLSRHNQRLSARRKDPESQQSRRKVLYALPKGVTDPSGTNNTGAMADPEFANFRKSFFIATQHLHFTTCKGYIGLSDVTQANDEIWILFGGSVPFILRPYPNDSDHAGSYSLVGDYYAHGIMDSEAMASFSERDTRGLSTVTGRCSIATPPLFQASFRPPVPMFLFTLALIVLAGRTTRAV